MIGSEVVLFWCLGSNIQGNEKHPLISAWSKVWLTRAQGYTSPSRAALPSGAQKEQT